MGHKRRDDTGPLKDLNTERILDRISKYKTSWIKHVDLIQRDEFPELLKITRLMD
jgi:hypothetical protein